MINDEIRTMQNQLNQMVVGNVDYKKIYEVSVRLDKLIMEYYHSQRHNTGRNNDLLP